MVINTIIVYGLVDNCYPHARGLAIHKAIAVPNSKDGRALFMEYQEKHEWRGMEINKNIMSIEAFNKLNKKQNNSIVLLEEVQSKP